LTAALANHCPQPFKLCAPEVLQLANTAPTSELELVLVIEDAEERLGPEEREQLLQVVATHLGAGRRVAEAAAAGAGAQ
jgi:RNA polymerase Rpb4